MIYVFQICPMALLAMMLWNIQHKSRISLPDVGVELSPAHNNCFTCLRWQNAHGDTVEFGRHSCDRALNACTLQRNYGRLPLVNWCDVRFKSPVKCTFFHSFTPSPPFFFATLLWCFLHINKLSLLMQSVYFWTRSHEACWFVCWLALLLTPFNEETIGNSSGALFSTPRS